jgi:ribosomal protein S18 acetylase RimI-like enzyme
MFMDNEKQNFDERLVLRPVVLPDDEEFLIGLYYTTRDDIAMTPLDEDQKKTLSMMQYLAQKQHYTATYHNSIHDIIMFDGKPAGRLWTARYEDEIVGIDLAILPEYRNHQIGTKLLKDLFRETAETKRVFNFTVQKTNERALRLYLRLNCRMTGETPTHFQLQWRPENDLLRSTEK